MADRSTVDGRPQQYLPADRSTIWPLGGIALTSASSLRPPSREARLDLGQQAGPIFRPRRTLHWPLQDDVASSFTSVEKCTVRACA